MSVMMRCGNRILTSRSSFSANSAAISWASGTNVALNACRKTSRIALPSPLVSDAWTPTAAVTHSAAELRASMLVAGISAPNLRCCHSSAGLDCPAELKAAPKRLEEVQPALAVSHCVAASVAIFVVAPCGNGMMMPPMGDASDVRAFNFR